MHMLMLSGMQITSPRRFSKYFSPVDFLLHKELAAGFAKHQLQKISQWNGYNAEMLYFALFYMDVCYSFDPSKPACYQDYFEAGEVPEGLKTDEKANALLKRIWDISFKADLEENDQKRLFCILSAGYFLANRTFEECPITPEEAAAAFCGKILQKEEEKWYTFSAQEAEKITARGTPYCILAQASPDPKKGICLKKLTAVKNNKSITTQFVDLELYHRATDEKPFQSIRLAEGDYCYCLFAEDKPIRVLDLVAENGDYYMKREKDNIFLYQKGVDKSIKTISCKGREILSFAPESNGKGYIIADTKGVDYTAYSQYEFYQYYLPDTDIIQVRLEGSLCLLLNKKGAVFANKDMQKYSASQINLYDIKI